eukprot:SAG22_NODE_2993_length_2043_cov_5.008230_3_plen_169_part_00
MGLQSGTSEEDGSSSDDDLSSSSEDEGRARSSAGGAAKPMDLGSGPKFDTALVSLSTPFCNFCGAMLDVADLGDSDDSVTCTDCNRKAKIDLTAVVEVTRALDGSKFVADDGVSADKRDEDQPTIEEECPSCAHNMAYYRTMQLRSADEGQTIFYTCTECGWKCRQNS